MTLTTVRVDIVSAICDLCNEPIENSNVLGVSGYAVVFTATSPEGKKFEGVLHEPFAYCNPCEELLGSINMDNILRMHKLMMIPMIMQMNITSYSLSVKPDNGTNHEYIVII